MVGVGTWIADDDEFDFHLYRFAQKCTNWEEIKEKLGEKIEEERKLREWANEEERKNPDEWRVLPYGWSPFGFYL